ncbi:MAG: curlin repeat-containing protein [Paludibacter sp.]|nr:curlin repeat-containing protein [Paludibacter sp.]
MKKNNVYLLLVLFIPLSGFSQDIIKNTEKVANKSIQQIHLPGIDDLLAIQNLSQNVNNYVQIQQTGNGNSASITQQNGTAFDMSNQSFTVQSGNSNELTLGQIGSGNLLLGFQLDYVSKVPVQKKNKLPGFTNSLLFTNSKPTDENDYLVEGERNKMTITQDGTNNGVMVVQQGSDNTISADQKGNNNYLLAWQKGSNNSITDYKQANDDSNQNLYDRVIQIGDNLSFKSVEVSKTSLTGNTFMQTGTNLALELNSDLINSAGGIEVKQTGKDMKIVIDQSYFSFPLK